VITGKLGGGKSLLAVKMICDYVNEGRQVATNLDLYPENFNNKNDKTIRITRIADRPSISHLEAIGKGYDGQYQGEHKNGLLVLDECGTWLNSRDWNDRSRKDVIQWMLHARKLRWDVVLIIQHIEMLDKQVVKSLAEHTIWMRRFDKFRIPLIGQITKALGKEVRMPRLHVGIVKYGDTQQHPTVDKHIFRGSYYQPLYDTEQAFYDYDAGNYMLLTPWHLVGRYTKNSTMTDYLNKYLLPIIRVVVFIPYYYLHRTADLFKEVSRSIKEGKV
jgi:hypothetical protein